MKKIFLLKIQKKNFKKEKIQKSGSECSLDVCETNFEEFSDFYWSKLEVWILAQTGDKKGSQMYIFDFKNTKNIYNNNNFSIINFSIINFPIINFYYYYYFNILIKNLNNLSSIKF